MLHVWVVERLHPHAVQWYPHDHLVGEARWVGDAVEEEVVELVGGWGGGKGR